MSTAESSIVELENARAEQVRKQIKQLQGAVKDHTFDLAELLAEVQQGSYYRDWGYSSFKAWLDSSELDIKSRQADYVIKIVIMSKQLDITRERLRLVKISKLKAIFSLNPDAEYVVDTDPDGKPIRMSGGDVIRDLVQRSVNMSLDEVERIVRILKGEEDAEDPMVWLNLRVRKKAKEEVIEPAIEETKAAAGSEMSDGEAIELICANARSGYHEEADHEIAQYAKENEE